MKTEQIFTAVEETIKVIGASMVVATVGIILAVAVTYLHHEEKPACYRHHDATTSTEALLAAREEAAIRSVGYSLQFVSLPHGVCGNLAGATVTIAPELSVSDQLSTMLHERAHIALGSSTKTAPTMEVEAETVATIVEQTLGVGDVPASYGYIVGWMRDPEYEGADPKAIHDAAEQMIRELRTL